MNALLLSLRFAENADKYSYYLGSGHDKSEKLSCNSIAFGNCAIKVLDECIYVKGCPPYPFELKSVINEL